MHLFAGRRRRGVGRYVGEVFIAWAEPSCRGRRYVVSAPKPLRCGTHLLHAVQLSREGVSLEILGTHTFSISFHSRLAWESETPETPGGALGALDRDATQPFALRRRRRARATVEEGNPRETEVLGTDLVGSWILPIISFSMCAPLRVRSHNRTLERWRGLSPGRRSGLSAWRD